MAPKRKGVSVNLRDLQREMGVGAAMLLPSAPKPVDEAAAERSRYGGNREGYGNRSGGGGGGSGVRWADRDSDDDDEWRRDDEGQTNGVAPRGQRAQAPDIPDEPWRSAPRQAPATGGDAPPGRHGSSALQRGGEGEGAGDAEKDWGVLRSASRGIGSHGEADRGGGPRDEDVDFAEVRRAAPQQPRKQQQQHQSGTAAADAEDALDFASLRSARSIDRLTRGGGAGGDDRPVHLRTLRSRLAEKAAEKLHHQQETGTAGGVRAAAAQQPLETNVSSPLRTASSGAPGGGGATAFLASRMSSIGALGQTAGGGESGGSGRPARYIPPSKRGATAPASGAGTAAVINTRAAAFLESEEERKPPHVSTTMRGTGGGVHPPSSSRQELKSKSEKSFADAAVPDVSSAAAGAKEDVSCEGSAKKGVQTPGDILRKQQYEKEEEGEEKEEEKVKEGPASTAATPAATASPAAETSPGAATPVKEGVPAAVEGSASSLPAGAGSDSAATGDAAAAGGGDQGMQKAVPRWKQRLEQRKREQEATKTGAVSSSIGAPGGGASATPEAGGICAGEKDTLATESLPPSNNSSSGGGVPVAEEGMRGGSIEEVSGSPPAVSPANNGPAPPASAGSSERPSIGSPATASLLSSTVSRAHTLQQEVIQLQPIRLASATTTATTKRVDAGLSGEGGKYVPPSLLRQQKQQQYQHGGLGSSLSTAAAAGKTSYPTDVQRLFLQAAANSAGLRGIRSQGASTTGVVGGGGERGEKGKTGVFLGSGRSGPDAVTPTTAPESEEKKKEQRKKEKELEKERQKQETLMKERERQEKLWKHEEDQVHTFVELLEKTLDQAGGAEKKQQLSAEQQSEKVEDGREGSEEKDETEEKEGHISNSMKEEDLMLQEHAEEERKLILSEKEGGILSEDTLKGMVPCIVVAAALMKRCMQKEDFEQVREEVQRASYLWKELLRRSEVDEKDQVLIKEMTRAVKAVKCPRLSASVSLIEALWDAMVATNILPDTAFIKWFEDTRDETEGRTEVLFQEDLEDEVDDDVDIEALVPKRGKQKTLK